MAVRREGRGVNITARPAPPRPTYLRSFVLGVVQILVWGGSFFLMSVLAAPVAKDTGWPAPWIYGSLSLSILISGLLAPAVGRRVARHGGTRMLATSGAVIGAGLLAVGLAPSLWVFVAGWCVIGVGMALGLYDALFATLGYHYGSAAKGAIVQITLISGLCTTVTWPLLGWAVAQWGWRGACVGYAALLALCVFPLTLLALPTARRQDAAPAAPAASAAHGHIDRTLYGMIAINFTLSSVIMTMVSVQLLGVLQAKGLSAAEALGLGALIGPFQIAARLFDAVGPKKHPIWSALAASALTAVGMLGLLAGPWALLAGVVCYALGNGMRAIVRGTLPLALFDQRDYPVILGRLALPTLVAQALTPLLGEQVQRLAGPDTLLAVMLGFALVNLLIIIWITFRLMGRGARLSRPA